MEMYKNEETPKEKGPRGESDCVNSPRKKGKGGVPVQTKTPTPWKVRLESSEILDGQSLAHMEIPHKLPRGMNFEKYFFLDFSIV